MSHHIDHAEIERERRELAGWKETYRLARLDEIQQALEEERELRRSDAQMSAVGVSLLTLPIGALLFAIWEWTGVLVAMVVCLAQVFWITARVTRAWRKVAKYGP